MKNTANHEDAQAPQRHPNAGSFKPGHDSRRHRFTPEECREGFYSALASVTEDYGETAARNFLKAKLGQSYDPRRSANFRERRAAR
jgi:hypothetical protein